MLSSTLSRTSSVSETTGINIQSAEDMEIEEDGGNEDNQICCSVVYSYMAPYRVSLALTQQTMIWIRFKIIQLVSSLGFPFGRAPSFPPLSPSFPLFPLSIEKTTSSHLKPSPPDLPPPPPPKLSSVFVRPLVCPKVEDFYPGTHCDPNYHSSFGYHTCSPLYHTHQATQNDAGFLQQEKLRVGYPELCPAPCGSKRRLRFRLTTSLVSQT